jgi:hypothetical protein
MERKSLFGSVLMGCLCLWSLICLCSLTGTASAQTGFAWACAPTTASYNAAVTCAPYGYNSRGGAVDVTRSSVGMYAVDFVGLGGRTVAGGNVQVTAYSTLNIVCNVYDWASSGVNFTAYVRCFTTTSGLVADSDFTILVGWFGQ